MAFPDGARASEIDVVLFGSMEGGAQSFATSGVKLGLPEDGPALLVSFGGGRQVEASRTVTGAPVERLRTVAIASAVFGYQWFRDWGAVGLFAGPEGTLTLVSDGAAGLQRQVETGMRLHGQAWIRPTDETLVEATLVAGTTKLGAWARLAGGIRFGEGYVGPEATAYADASDYRKWTFGLHATDYTLLSTHLRLSVGGRMASDARRIGPYVAWASWVSW